MTEHAQGGQNDVILRVEKMYVNMLRMMLFCRKLSVNVIRMTKLLRMVLSFLPEMISARDQRRGDIICMSLRIMLRVYKELRIYNELVSPAHTSVRKS